jgi:hypothetical protein
MPAPGVAVQGGQGFHQLHPQWVEVDVANQLEQIRLLLHEDGFVPVLEKVADPAMAPVEGARVASEEDPHGAGERSGSCADEEVGVIWEQGPGEDLKSCACTDRLEPDEKVLPVPVVLENHLPVEAPDHHVVEGPGKIKARPARHGRSLAAGDARVKRYLS